MGEPGCDRGTHAADTKSIITHGLYEDDDAPQSRMFDTSRCR